MNDTAIDAPHTGIDRKELLTKLFSIKKNTKDNVAEVLTLEHDLKQKKIAYKLLLKHIIDVVHEISANDSNQEISQNNYTEDGQRMHFDFDDPIIKSILSQYEFLKTWDTLDKTKIKELITLLHKNNLHLDIAKYSNWTFNEDNRPYLATDETGIILKKAMQLRDGNFIDIPSWANSFN